MTERRAVADPGPAGPPWEPPALAWFVERWPWSRHLRLPTLALGGPAALAFSALHVAAMVRKRTLCPFPERSYARGDGAEL